MKVTFMVEKKSVFIAIPTHEVKGDAIDDNILDAFSEIMEINPEKIKVIENKNNFFIFSDELHIDINAANQQIINTRILNVNYDKAIHYLTKLVRRSDSAQNRLIEGNSELKLLRSRNTELKSKLEKLQKQNFDL